MSISFMPGAENKRSLPANSILWEKVVILTIMNNKIITPDGRQSIRPRNQGRNRIEGYRRQDERPVERTQDLRPTDRQDRTNADNCKDETPKREET